MKNYESFDPTDPFGKNTIVYVHNSRILKIEPQFSSDSLNSWLTDKGRLFFDTFFGKAESPAPSGIILWEKLFKSILKMTNIFNLCSFKTASKFFFVLIFENVSLEIVSFLCLISQLNSFIKIKRGESSSLNSNLETNFQVNAASSSSHLSSSSLCFLIGTNTRYEGSYLNLKLRQRYLKGNFKLIILGSSLDLTFPVSFMGSNCAVLKNMVEGNHAVCKDVIHAENPLFVVNTESLKHSSVKEFMDSLRVLKHSNFLNEVWNGFNLLNSSLYESGLNFFSRFSFLSEKDFVRFSSFYAFNVDLSQISSLQSVMESRLLRYKNSNEFFPEKLFVDQTVFRREFTFADAAKHAYAPSNMFFENQETFITTEGFRKISSKLILKKNTKSDWQVLRKFGHNFAHNNHLNCKKDNVVLFYDNSSLFNFKNFLNFQFQATPQLTNFNANVLFSNQKFVLFKSFPFFKSLTVKLLKTKLKFWLDDFYLGGKDHFCQNSLTLIRSSSHYKLQITNFH